jgi:hypothetical protein
LYGKLIYRKISVYTGQSNGENQPKILVETSNGIRNLDTNVRDVGKFILYDDDDDDGENDGLQGKLSLLFVPFAYSAGLSFQFV